jgi:ubiquinone biosynthesis protein Coq4/catechol 2,3-dioxygenase-like lactoylglutathione lyase family enzyme
MDAAGEVTSGRWVDRVRRPQAGAPRRLFEELSISLEALAEITKDTGQTRYAFEAIENFPLADVLRAWNGRLDWAADAALVTRWKERETPDLRRAPALALAALPEGTLGHAYARFVEARGLDNDFLEYLEVTDLPTFVAHRTAHLHDLLHFVLGYEPYDPVGEMEIEAFLLAQTGALHHVLFLLGWSMFLLRNDPAQLAAGRARLFEAYRLGRRVRPLLSEKWSEHLHRPLAELKEELGIAHRPEARAWREPEVTPRLAHVVWNVPDLSHAIYFYTRVFGYRVVARDPALGAVFLSAGDDHHTLALQETPSLLPWKLPEALRRVRALVASRHEGGHSRRGQRRVLPSLPVLLAGLRPGLHHVGFRVQSDEELRAYLRRLTSAGARVVWRVNHGDFIHGVYVRDPAGHLLELFVDGEEARALVARGAFTETREVTLASYELGLEEPSS